MANRKRERERNSEREKPYRQILYNIKPRVRNVDKICIGALWSIIYYWTSCKSSSTYITETCYLLTPWCRVLLEKLTGLQLVKKFPAFHGTRRFITALTSVRQPNPVHILTSHLLEIHSNIIHPSTPRSPQ